MKPGISAQEQSGRIGSGQSAHGRAARGSRRDLLGGHHLPKGNNDVGLPGADGTGTGVAGQQVTQGVREAAFDPVAHHHADAGRSRGKEAGGCG